MLFADFSIMTTIESCADPSGQATTPGPAGNENLTRGKIECDNTIKLNIICNT